MKTPPLLLQEAPQPKLLPAPLSLAVTAPVIVDRETIREQLKGTQVEAALAVESSVQQTRGTGGAAFAGRMMPRHELDALVREFDARFDETAQTLDDYKAARLASLGKKPVAEALVRLIEEANVMHRKPGHTESVVAFLRAVLDVCPPELKREMNWRDVLEAARWLNLADLKLPVRVLAGGKLLDGDLEKYIKPRAQISADLHHTYNLGNERVANLILAHRARGDRSIGAQLLDLADQLMAMAAKPFFRTTDRIDGPKVAEKLAPQKATFDPTLFNIIMGALGDGTADRALARERIDDLYVR